MSEVIQRHDYLSVTEMRYVLDRAKDNPDSERKGDGGYAFPTRSRCPQCDSLHTLAVRTGGRHQYRKCQDCSHCFKVIGWRI